MKAFAILLLALNGSASAQTIIRQNIPGLNVQDITSRAVILDNDGQIYQSIPGMANVKDITQPAYYIQGNEIIPEAIPSLKSRDFSEPSFTVEDQ